MADKEAPELLEPETAKEFKPLDFIVSCGDLQPEYLSWLRNYLDAPLYYVKGNHDLRYRESPPVGCTNIHRRIIRHGPVSLMGLEGCHWYNGGPQQYTQKQMSRMALWARVRARLRGGVNIVVTHAAPLGIGDTKDRCHIGFKAFTDLIDKHRPDYLLHGHVHENFSHDSQRIHREVRTTVINCFTYYLLEIDV